MTRSKQDKTLATLSACLTRKGCSRVIAATAFSSGRWQVLKTAHHSERERCFPSHFGCGSAAVCIGDRAFVRGALGLRYLGDPVQRIIGVLGEVPQRVDRLEHV